MNSASVLRREHLSKAQRELTFNRVLETGFPSPAGDHLDKALDLEELIVLRPSATFYVRVEGHAMSRSGICDKDILVVDRSLTARHGDIVVVSVQDECVIRRLFKQQQTVMLVSDNPSFEPIPISEEANWMIWGVVTHLIHRYRV